MKAMIIQTFMGCIGAVGFALLFNIRDRKLIWIGVGGTLGWTAYLICISMGENVFTALFFATATVVTFSEVLARLIKAPIIMLMVPMLIPLIPGGDLYYTMRFFIENKYSYFGESARLLLVQAGAIAVGIITMTSVMSMLFKLIYRYKNLRP